jgi:uncharacterized protein (TIGR02452 family)
MSRDERSKMAKQTLAICEAGFYFAPNGARVEIAEPLAHAKSGTRIHAPDRLSTDDGMKSGRVTRFTVRNETTFQAIARFAALKQGHVACLNFASAKNPGGGFLNGAMAQEEALAFASGLYPCLLEAPEYYERNRSNRSALYLDLAIYSPLVLFFRNDAGALLENAVFASVITAPAPNAGAIAQNEPANLKQVEPTLRRRAELILAIAAGYGVDQLVLGAWGCGVFRNDPRVVAKIFGELLKGNGKFTTAFREVAFAVLDRSERQDSLRAFQNEFSQT